MPARTSPAWAPRRFGEKRVDQAEIEAIEDGAVVEQRAPQAALGVAGELAIAEREVGASYGNVRDGEGIRDGAQQRCVAGGYVGEGRARVEGENEGDAKAAWTDDHRSPAGVAAKHRNPAGRAGVDVHPGIRGAIAGQDDGGVCGLPDEQALPSSKTALRVASVDARAPGALQARQRVPFLAEPRCGWHQAQVGELHRGWRYNPGNQR